MISSLRDALLVLACSVYLAEHQYTLSTLIQYFNKLVGIE